MKSDESTSPFMILAFLLQFLPLPLFLRAESLAAPDDKPANMTKPILRLTRYCVCW